MSRILQAKGMIFKSLGNCEEVSPLIGNLYLDIFFSLHNTTIFNTTRENCTTIEQELDNGETVIFRQIKQRQCLDRFSVNLKIYKCMNGCTIILQRLKINVFLKFFSSLRRYLHKIQNTLIAFEANFS